MPKMKTTPKDSDVNLKFSNYPELLEEIRKRPQMYLGGNERDLALLATYLDGFSMGESFHKITPELQMGGFDWSEFEEWVKNKYNTKRLCAHSMPLALHISNSNSEAFDLWFSWYDLFMNEK